MKKLDKIFKYLPTFEEFKRKNIQIVKGLRSFIFKLCPVCGGSGKLNMFSRVEKKAKKIECANCYGTGRIK